MNLYKACWRFTVVVPVSVSNIRGSASSDVGDYRLISITPVLSKVFEKIVAGKLSFFGE